MSTIRRSLVIAAALLLAGAGIQPASAGAAIPDEALLQAADLGGVTPHATDEDDWPQLRPPRPCGATVPTAITDRAVAAVIDVDRSPEAIMEYLALHRDPDRYLRKLKKALRNCPDWSLESSRPDGLTLRWTQRWEHVGEQVTHHTYVAVGHTGRAVVVVADSGWETSSGDPAVAERLLTSAVRRASVLR
ncbi:hypothetical protein [Actinoplanes subglobosus]|uniref:PknH-like extracellular domain-containing protein n=1 Tax=Actinoplanes subglobosus TaxID=1547892 RepID=A0ABV8J1N2_9ACTN